MKVMFRKPPRRRYYWLFSMILFYHLLPLYIRQVFERFNPINTILAGLSMLLSALIIVTNRKAVRPLILLFLLPYVFLFVSTFLSNGDLMQVFVKGIRVILLCLVVERAMRSNEMTDGFLYAVRNLTILFFLMNLVTILVLPKGIPSMTTGRIAYNMYGNPNATIRHILPGICCSCIIDNRANRKMSFLTCFFFAGVFFYLFVSYFSATTFIAAVFLLIWLIFKGRISSHERLVYTSIIAVVAYLEITLVVLFSNITLTNFITSIFNKSVNFSGRTRLWSNALMYFLNKPTFGHGLKSSEIIEYEIGNLNGAHNYYLDLLYERGVVGLLAMLLIIILPIFKLKKEYSLSGTIYVLVGFCCSCIIMFLSEPFLGTEYLILPMFYALNSLLFRGSNVQDGKAYR